MQRHTIIELSSVGLITSVLILFGCKTPATQDAALDLGQLGYDFELASAVKPHFDRGMLYLHNFEYEDAREAFQEALLHDSLSIMAIWGETMTYYKALWGLQDVEAGRKVMQRLGSTMEERLAAIANPLEAGLWEGLERLFGNGEFKERNRSFADHMANLYEIYGDNQEVAALYALGLLWSGDLSAEGNDARLAARIVDGILKENPRHPGALHYKIHALDHPVFAADALAAADAYAVVAADATHALHMPSHIYLALGMWESVVRANEASYEASVQQMNRKGQGDGARGYHSYAWMHYGYLQQGRYEDAAALLRLMPIYVKNEPTAGARSYMISMQCAQWSDANNYEQAFEYPDQLKTEDLGISTQAAHIWLMVQKALMAGEPDQVEIKIDELQGKIAQASLLVTEDGLAMCSAGPTRYAPSRNSLMVATTLKAQIEAQVLLQKGELVRAEELFKRATDLELQTEFGTGPPDVATPSFEMYGRWLLDQDRPAEALVQFEKSLERAPNRAKALQGKIEALTALGHTTQLEETTALLESIWAMADPGIRQRML